MRAGEEGISIRTHGTPPRASKNGVVDPRARIGGGWGGGAQPLWPGCGGGGEQSAVNGWQLCPLGDSAVRIQFGDQLDETVHRRLLTIADQLRQHPFEGMEECVPAYTTLTVFYNPVHMDYADVEQRLTEVLQQMSDAPVQPGRTVEIPVCYGGAYGPDIEFVALHHGFTVEEVIAMHTAAAYRVYALGFSPGFPYLGGLPTALATPRRATPRLAVPAGSVGIAGVQTGVYPVETPGGWQIIGRTPLALFRPWEHPPTLLAPGDTVRFRAIPSEAFDAWAEGGRTS